ncbi:cupin-like domain-containing protein [Piscinibacter sp. XHJ-5]|uniref:cupin-like domain-containing protein n=1 Tax=Piscinibacter sp. XHJ-5 TaxID=3037797 RepID=UPI0024529A4A|nr:cupin-like domain-containing protein [Piscinibacter sp. XHJ-5]
MSSPFKPITPAPRPRNDAPSSPRPLDAAWQRWIVEQRLRGCTVESMLQSLQGAGHARADAERAIAAIESEPAYAVAQAVQQRHRKLEAVALNLQRLWASDPQYRRVEKRADLSADEFAARYVRGCRPVVLTGHTRDWPAMRTWSPEDLKRRFGHLDVDVQSERNADTNYEQNKLKLTRRVNLGAFVDQVVRGGPTNDYYLTANNELLRRPEFAPLLADIGSLPPLCDRSQLMERSSFWFGPAGTVTPLHHDTLMLFHTQVVGRKRWRFVSPLEWSRVYNLRNVFSEVDLERPDPARFPDFQDAAVLEVVVEPGETMFLPLAWWHQVASLDVSLSFSYSCLAVPNQFDYPDPAAPVPLPPAPPPVRTADAMQAELLNAVAAAGGIVEAQFGDGSALRFRSGVSGIEVQVNLAGSRASYYGERLAGLARDGRAIQCHFADGSSISIMPFG